MKIPAAVRDWLLEENNPPVRYLTLTHLCGESERSTGVRQAKARLMNYAVTQGILKHADEFWHEDHDRAYWKYTGKYWQMIFLGQFLADGRAPRIAKGVQDILEKRKWVIKSGGQCLTANILSAARRLGYGDHPVVIEETEALADRVVADGGIRCAAMEYSLLAHCYMAQPKLLLCFAQVPAKKRSPGVRSAIELLVNNLLKHEVLNYVPGNLKQWQQVLAQQPKRADLPKGKTVKAWIAEQRRAFLSKPGLGAGKPKQGWKKFGFPLHYNSDVLEALYALALLQTPMKPELKKALQLVKDKQTPNGTWIMENSLNGKMWVDVEEKGKPSKWLTYFALCVLDQFGFSG